MAKKIATTWLVTQLAQRVGLQGISPYLSSYFNFKF